MQYLLLAKIETTFLSNGTVAPVTWTTTEASEVAPATTEAAAQQHLAAKLRKISVATRREVLRGGVG